jgi:hypothetical protein
MVQSPYGLAEAAGASFVSWFGASPTIDGKAASRPARRYAWRTTSTISPGRRRSPSAAIGSGIPNRASATPPAMQATVSLSPPIEIAFRAD